MDYNEHEIRTWQEPPKPSSGLGVASLVCGIVSVVGLCFCLGPVTGILAVIFGIIQIKRTPDNKAMSIAGIITGLIGILLALAIFAVITISISFSDSSVDIDNFYKEFYDEIYENYDL